MIKKGRFWISLIIVWAVSVSLVFLFCSRQQKGLTFGVSYMTMNNPFYSIINNSMKKEVESRGDSLMVYDPLLSTDRQIEQIEAMIQQGVDGLFINPIDSQALADVLEEARQKKIPVIIFDSPVSDTIYSLATITSDNYQAGVLCADNMMEHLDSARILLLEHSQVLSAATRIQGFEDTIKGHPEYQIVGEIECEGQLETAMPLTAEKLEEGLDVDVIMCLNDPSALGAMAALESQGITDVLVYGVDGTPDFKQKLLEENCMQATAAQSPITIGTQAALTMYAILNGEAYETEQILPVYLIDRSVITKSSAGGWQ